MLQLSLYHPQVGRGVFGGQIASQATWAASQTVTGEYSLHVSISKGCEVDTMDVSIAHCVFCDALLQSLHVSCRLFRRLVQDLSNWPSRCA